MVPATAAAAAPSTAAASATPAGSSYTPVVPARLADTRNSGKPPANGGIAVSFSTDQVPPGATAVVLNLTGLDADAPTYITVYPSDGPATGVSNLNIIPGEIRANLVTVPLTAARSEMVMSGPRATDMVVDLEGYYSPSTARGSLRRRRGGCSTRATAPAAYRERSNPDRRSALTCRHRCPSAPRAEGETDHRGRNVDELT